MKQFAFATILVLAASVAVTATAAAQDGAATCRNQAAAVVGTDGDDTLLGTDGDDVIYSGDGNDTIDGLGGDDLICSGNGDDIVAGGAGVDVIFGGAGDDQLWADSPAQNFSTDQPGSRIVGGPGNDILHGSDDDDTLVGNRGLDQLFGNAGDDHLRGGHGRDEVYGGNGSDDVGGGKGADRITAALGDTVRGGPGSDWCVVTDTPELLLSCGENDFELDRERVRFAPGTYAVPAEVPYGYYRTDAGISVVDLRDDPVQFSGLATRVDTVAPLDPIGAFGGEFLVDYDIPPGRYRITPADEGDGFVEVTLVDGLGKTIEVFEREGFLVVDIAPEVTIVEIRGVISVEQ